MTSVYEIDARHLERRKNSVSIDERYIKLDTEEWRWLFSVVFISVWVDNEEAKKEESIQQHTREKDMSGNILQTNENDTTALIICIFIMTIYMVHDERNR